MDDDCWDELGAVAHHLQCTLAIQLVRVQEVMLHFLDKENLVEKQDVSLVAVGAIVCNRHIGNRHIRQGGKIRMETQNGNRRQKHQNCELYDMGIRSKSASIDM